MRNRKLAITMALGALAAGCYAGYRRSQGLSSRPAAKPEYLQTWEGEGGGVPVDTHHTASQVQPRERPGDREDMAPGPADGSPASLRDSSSATALRDSGSGDSTLR
ncbi:hypothetical protein [Methylibium sp.]|uniref:hypothetical protein n=1 Tax=Methylibium sp. TaxID=2067992 RepID=UPI00183BBBAA|nr:hypothetical protein [Methylibium sp.]MBA3589652.1 hypothetical protein [Methylibium sp.]